MHEIAGLRPIRDVQLADHHQQVPATTPILKAALPNQAYGALEKNRNASSTRLNHVAPPTDERDVKSFEYGSRGNSLCFCQHHKFHSRFRARRGDMALNVSGYAVLRGTCVKYDQSISILNWTRDPQTQ